MTKRNCYNVTITLLSDAILGSGESVPGAEDIALQCNEQGFPYINGTTFKGLLRESMENLLVWTQRDPQILDSILGKPQRGWFDDRRRVTLSHFEMVDPPQDSSQCISRRTFTQLENGIIKKGTLRVAACVPAGWRFAGVLECNCSDEQLVKDALKGIRYLGTMRNRGFGHVCITMDASARVSRKPVKISEGSWICYTLHTLTGLAVTDPQLSTDDNIATRGFLPGGAVRGMILNAIAREDPEWFRAHRRVLLSKVRFLDAIPNPDPEALAAIPSPMGFYEDKQEQVLESLFPDGRFSPGLKRASLGSFCALDRGTLHYWNARTDGTIRILRDVEDNEKKMFRTQYLAEGQSFIGYIYAEDTAVREKISQVFYRDIWLGADRYAGFGHCRVDQFSCCTAPKWIDAYGCVRPGKTFYLMAISPFAMCDPLGEPRGIYLPDLARRLGVEAVRIERCASSLTEIGGYNRTLESRLPSVRMYDRGSVFKVTCTEPPAAEALQQLQTYGLGVRKEEGYGMVLVLPETLFTGGITGKRRYTSTKGRQEDIVRQQRLEELRWLQKNRTQLAPGRDTLSASQSGRLQEVCSTALKRDDLSVLNNWLDHNIANNDWEKKKKFREACNFITSVLENRNGSVPAHLRTWQQRLALVIRLIDYTRKED